MEIPTDSTELEARNTADPPAKAAGKVRLLTLASLDQRTAAYRECRKLIDEIVADLGGSDRLSTAELQLVQRAAVLGAVLEDTESRWIEGQPIDPTSYCTVINAQRRVLESLGLQRRARDVTGSIDDIVREIEAEREAAA